MTLADDLKPMAREIRGIPGELGIRPHRVWIVEGHFAGEHTGDGKRFGDSHEIVEGGGHPPKVRWLRDDEIAVGGLAAGTVEVGPFTADVTGSTVRQRLLNAADIENGNTLHIRIQGPMHPTGAIYRLRRKFEDRAIHYRIQCEPIAETAY